MRTFNDTAGRNWTVQLNVDTFKRIRDLLDVNPFDPQAFIVPLIDDPIFLCDVLYAVCKPEADARGISDADFGRAMAGPCIKLAKDAIIAEYRDFFRDQEKFEAVTAAIDAAEKMAQAIYAEATKRLHRINLPAAIAAAYGERSTGSQESSGSIQDD